MILTPGIDKLITAMKRHAATGFFDGRSQTPYFHNAFRFHKPTGTSLCFTRDSGMHTCGWFKNPDYERCFHLSISFRDPETRESVPFDYKTARFWVRAFYGDWQRYSWHEPPSTEPGINREVHHYRVFCDPHWYPILPRGEVYSKELTEIGWKSFSELKDERK